MKKKTVSRLSAMFLAGAMVVATFGMSVCAEDEVTSINSVPVKKTVSAEQNVRAPFTSFEFQVKPGESTTTADGDLIYAGVEDGAYFAENAETIDFTNAGATLTGDTAISLDVNAFDKPGIYRYVVSEVAPDTKYDGITYDTKTYNLDVYVELVNGVKTITAVTLDGTAVGTSGGESVKVDAAAFTNSYETNNLTVTKKIEGNQAVKTTKFEFTITINGTAGETYTLLQDGESQVVTSGTPVKVYLADEDSVTVYGLSAQDTYTIVETDTQDGYKTAITGADEATGLTAKGNTAAGDDSVVYTNTKNVATPTGLIASYAPYILMVVVAGAAVVLFLRRRNRAEF